MKYLFIFLFFYSSAFATEVFKYTLQELAFTVSETNNINIIIDDKVDNEKIFYFNDSLDKDLSFDSFLFMLKDINYEISFNGKFYYITKNNSDSFKYYYFKNPLITSDKLLLLSKEFNIDLSLSDTHQIVAKYINYDDLKNFQKYLDNYLPPKHILLEGEILAVNETKLNELGIDFASIASTIKTTGSFDIGLFSNINYNDSIKKIISSNGISSLGDISVFISLLNATGYSKVVTRPNMLIRSGDKSTFQSGQQIRIVTGSTDSIRNTGEYSSKQYEMLGLGLILECNADIYNDDISLDFKFSVKDINTYQPELDTLIIDNKSFDTKVSIKNGDSVVLAGLTTSVKQTKNYSIPFISNIPYLGSIFQHDYDSVETVSYLIYFKASIQ